LAGIGLAPKSQSRLDELLARSEVKLSVEETREIDLLLTQVDELNRLKARAIEFTCRVPMLPNSSDLFVPHRFAPRERNRQIDLAKPMAVTANIYLVGTPAVKTR
jgi:hypothetical protein